MRKKKTCSKVYKNIPHCYLKNIFNKHTQQTVEVQIRVWSKHQPLKASYLL